MTTATRAAQGWWQVLSWWLGCERCSLLSHLPWLPPRALAPSTQQHKSLLRVVVGSTDWNQRTELESQLKPSPLCSSVSSLETGVLEGPTSEGCYKITVS